MPAPIPLLALSLVLSAPNAKSSPPKTAAQLFQKARGCIYEVVVPKLRDSNAVYAERLPLEKLSFQERNDSVWSIGSAFAIGRDTVLTAAHVLELGEDIPSREPMLRDIEGRVHRLGKFLKFSNHQDFAVFTVPGLGAANPLRPSRNPQIGHPVHAVGNALGEGIVLREGLLTSQTPEDDDGEWKYWRFSAAASPGNSGGPLLDEQGDLVGVVLMKSESENLNYALPWTIVRDFPADRARYHERSAYTFPILPETELLTVFDTTFAVPPTWSQLDHALWTLSALKTARDRDSVLRSEHDQFFPRGKTARLRITPLYSTIPATVYRGQEGWWTLDLQETGSAVDLGRNGSWTQNKGGDFLFANVKVPDTVKTLDILDDSRLMGDLILRGGRLDRSVAGKDIRVTSLGKAVIDSLRTDPWGRTWIVRGWRKPWDGGILLTQILPLPNGFSLIMGVFSEGAARSHSGVRMQDFADHSTIPWVGTTAQWTQWLARPELVPPFLRSVRFEGPRKSPIVHWDGGTLALPEALGANLEEPVVLVSPAFLAEGKDSLRYGIGSVAVSPGYTSNGLAMLLRLAPPSPDLPSDVAADWRKHVEVRSPYDGKMVDLGQGRKQATRILPVSSRSADVDPAKSAPIWMAVVIAEDSPTQGQLDRLLTGVMKTAVVPTEIRIAP